MLQRSPLMISQLFENILFFCRRAKNREAARRSRQRKNERINHLCKDIKTLQQENVVLLKCIEDFTEKAINSKEHQLRMKEQLAAFATTKTGIETASLLAQYQDDSMLLPMEVEEAPERAVAVAAAAAGPRTQVGITGVPNPSSASVPATTSPNRASLVAGLSLPSLAELQKLQSTEAAGGQLTARGGGSGTLSARGTAVGEHIAMLSKENSPRDDEIDPALNTGGTAANTANAAAVLPTAISATMPAGMPDGSSVDLDMLFGAWNGSNKK